jgi:dCMP deaminase
MTKWDERFLDLAEYIAKWSTCKRRQCGAVIVKDKHILSTGYNGAPSGCKECINGRTCKRQELNIPSGQQTDICVATHAEQNAIIQAAKFGVSIDEASMYMTTQPCVTCAKMIINAGIKEIYYRGDYPDALALELLREAEVKMFKYDN